MNLRNSTLSTLFFLPAAMFMLVFLLYPITLLVKDSFYHIDLMNPSVKEFVGLANYIDSLSSERFLKALWNTVVYIGVAVGVEFILGLILALLLSHAFKGSQVIRTLLLSPLMLAPLVSGLIWKFMLNDQFGIFNWVLYKIGILSDPHQILWLSDSRYAIYSTIIADIWLTTPFIMLVLLAGIQGIPKTLYESADIDGANKWHKFRYITVPSLIPVASVALLIRIIDAARTFDIVWVLTQGGPGFSSELLSTYMYKTLTRYGQVGQSSAMAVIFIILLLILSSFFISKIWSPKKNHS
ncbi:MULTISPECIES: carbohydrate ABC transporter permease [Metabacillus]|uniref:Sugar ABC transporter permease n=2 Tax=Metabacillus TaxID=2675233 RepID=A0A179T7G6_9BACI|nr:MULTISPECIES: sugar ABC transporter permease [Metabacillus]OAS89228.1 sugar ABC transporter permease [Metabacillus litoralis]QNF28741.1 sugar ABC transporter permease [Metabacillus sp. KUDC1714]